MVGVQLKFLLHLERSLIRYPYWLVVMKPLIVMRQLFALNMQAGFAVTV